jgi:protein subunit release factor B
VKSQATRSRSQNQKIAKEILAAKVEALERGEQSREAIKNALKKKRKASSMKKKRRKYRALEEAKGAQELQDGVVEGDLEEDGDEYEEESKTEATSTTR